MSAGANWLVAAASVTGAGHIADGAVCQDAYAWRVTAAGALIVVVCDGAGSSTYGGQAARFVADTLCSAPSLDSWLNDAPTEAGWRAFGEGLFREVRAGLEALVAQTAPGATIGDFACTVQLAVVTECAVYVAHVGDGRAAARFDGGKWVPLFVPDRGEAPNETVFLSTPLKFDAEYWRAAAACVPGRADSVALMTDGCEAGAFECYVPAPTGGGLHDPNRPFPGFFDPVAATLGSHAVKGTPQSEIDAKWAAFLCDGLPRFAAESDDRTMVFAVRTA